MQRRDYYQISAFVFSLASHLIAFVQFKINFANLGVPERWFLQFSLLMGLSLAFAVLQFLLHRKEPALLLALLARVVILLVATYPLGNYVNVRLTLLTALTVEVMIYLETPANFVIAALVIAATLLVQKPFRPWKAEIPRLTLDNLLFTGFYPVTVMVLSYFLKYLRRLAVERRKLLEQLRQASANLVEANIRLQEYVLAGEDKAVLVERERISRELHDTIGYTLMNIIATMKASIELSRRDPEKLREFLAQTVEQAQKGLADTRGALRAMRSAKGPGPSIINAVRRLVDAFARTHITITAEFSNIPWSFGEEVDGIIYRIVQEGIVNAIRNGNADQIKIHFFQDEQKLNITVDDNGRGAEEIVEGIGLSGIRERLQKVSGGMSAANLTGGFRLYTWIPMGG
jgi:signal transduction histidine kinase